MANLGISKIDEFRVNKSVRFGNIPIWYPYKSGPRISNTKSLKKRSDRVQKEQGEFLSIVEETLSGLNIIKAFFAEKQFFNKFSNSTDRFFYFNNNLINRQNLASPLSEFLGIIVIGCLLWYGGKLVLIENTLQASVFMSFMLLAYNILTPAKAISKASYAISKGNSAAERILSLMNAINYISNKSSNIELDLSLIHI